jgi:hypothetical protein
VTRRTAIKTALKGMAYAAPIVVSASGSLPGVAAATPTITTCVQPVTFSDGYVLPADPGQTLDFYITLNTDPAGTFRSIGSGTADAFGVVNFSVSLTLNTSTVTAYTITDVPHGTTPTAASDHFTTDFISVVACTAGGPRAALGLFGFALIEPTLAACGGVGQPQFNALLNYGIYNGPPNTVYDVYVQPNNISPTGTFLKAATVTTNAQGNADVTLTILAPFSVVAPASYPTSVLAHVVPAGAPPQQVFLMATATPAANTLGAVPCPNGQNPPGVTATSVKATAQRRNRRH